jgi:uncharacterized protein
MDKQPDYEGAKQYALERLAREVPPTRFYHSLAHTRNDVLPAAERLARMEGVQGDDMLCLLTAACFHDVGYIDRPDDHEARSAEIASATLPQFGYSEQQIVLIRDIIMATKLPNNPQTLLEKIIADADMDSLGREDFLSAGLHLRHELEGLGSSTSDVQWYQQQYNFLQQHKYYTEAARQLRGPGKLRNIDAVVKILDDLRRNGERP